MYDRPRTIDELPPDCRHMFAELAEKLEFLPGDVICRQGDEDGYLYLLERGTLSVVAEDEQGEKRKLATITPGNFFGEINFIFGARRVASVIADEEALVSRLGQKQKNALIQRMPALYNRLRDLGLNRWGVIRFLAHPLLKDLPREEQEILTRDAVSSVYPSGTVLFDRGDRVDDFVLLLSGTMDLQGEASLEMHDGDWLLPAGGLDGGASLWRATAVIECMVVFVPLAPMRDLAARHADFGRLLERGRSV